MMHRHFPTSQVNGSRRVSISRVQFILTLLQVPMDDASNLVRYEIRHQEPLNLGNSKWHWMSRQRSSIWI